MILANLNQRLKGAFVTLSVICKTNGGILRKLDRKQVPREAKGFLCPLSVCLSWLSFSGATCIL